MKPTPQERAALGESIKYNKKKLRLSNAEIASRAGVDPGQTLKICNGQFQTFSDSVLRICGVLGLTDRGDGAKNAVRARPSPRSDPGWIKLEEAVKKAWDKTPQGAERLAKVIEAVGEVIKR